MPRRVDASTAARASRRWTSTRSWPADPQVALVDELAHTNVPGSRNAKRWQDIEELLDAGIDVISTVNIQHLESLNDVVEAITGVAQRETVPDEVVRAADQIELVDMSPEALRRRMAHGNVYAPEKVDAALANYFRVGNLTALRELALLWLADRVDEGLERYRADHGIDATVGGPRARRRRAHRRTRRARRCCAAAPHRRAHGAGGSWSPCTSLRGDGPTGAAPDDLARLRAARPRSSAAPSTPSSARTSPAAVLDFARAVNATQLVVGASRRGRLSTALRPSIGRRDRARAPGTSTCTWSRTRSAGRAAARRRRLAGRRRRRLAVGAGGRCSRSLLTVLLLPVPRRAEPADESCWPTCSASSALVAGRGAAAGARRRARRRACSRTGSSPRRVGTFTIAEPENALALVVFVVVAAAVATVVDRAPRRAQEAARRRAEADVLASLSAGVLRRGDGVEALLDQACETFGHAQRRAASRPRPTAAGCRVVEVVGSLAAAHRRTRPTSSSTPARGLVLALSGAPLPASDRARARRVRRPGRRRPRAGPARRRAPPTPTRLREADAVRTALLAAVSHDLRTPLAGIKAAVSTLRPDDVDLAADDRPSCSTTRRGVGRPARRAAWPTCST